MKTFLCFVVAVSLTASLAAQTARKPTAKRKTAAVTAEDIRALREALAAQSNALAAQQQQIQELKQELERKDQVWQQAQQQLQHTQATAADAQSKATAVETIASEERTSMAKLSSDVADVKTNLTASATSVQEERKQVSALEQVVGRFRHSGTRRQHLSELPNLSGSKPCTVESAVWFRRKTQRRFRRGLLSGHRFLGGLQFDQ